MVDLYQSSLVGCINGLLEISVYALFAELFFYVTDYVHDTLDILVELIALLQRLERN